MPFWRRAKSNQRPRFDLGQLGPAARKQLEGKGVKLPPSKPTRGKFNVSPKDQRTYEGVVFDSKWEMEVYVALVAAFGKEEVRLQQSFVLQDKHTDSLGNKHRAMTYCADFVVGSVVIDAKGRKTEVFRLKEKLFSAKFGHPIVCVHYRDQQSLRNAIDLCKTSLKK